MADIDEFAARLAALEARVEASEAVLAIQSMKARYGALVDERFANGAVVAPQALARVANEVAALFTPEGIWDGGPGLGTVTGRDAIAARLRDPTLAFSRHFFLNPRIEVSGHRARGRWELLSPCRRPHGTSYWMCGYEDDEYERGPEGWLHRSMRLTTVFMSPVGTGWTRILV